MKNKKIIAILVAIIVLIAAASGALYYFFGAQNQANSDEKSVTVNVVLPEKTSSYNVDTSAEYLRGLLEEMNIVEGEEGPYGLYVKTIDGVTVDESNEEWWKFEINGESTSTGVESAAFSDGDIIDITLMQGYDNF